MSLVPEHFSFNNAHNDTPSAVRILMSKCLRLKRVKIYTALFVPAEPKQQNEESKQKDEKKDAAKLVNSIVRIMTHSVLMGNEGALLDAKKKPEQFYQQFKETWHVLHESHGASELKCDPADFLWQPGQKAFKDSDQRKGKVVED
jgi:hypothetical protein